MPNYKVKLGYRHGVGKKYGPGDVVGLTEYEAQGFLDKLSLIQDEEPEATPTPPPSSPKEQPVLNLPDLDGTVKDVEKWLKTKPPVSGVWAALDLEEKGQNRIGATNLLEDYLQKNDPEFKDFLTDKEGDN